MGRDHAFQALNLLVLFALDRDHERIGTRFKRDDGSGKPDQRLALREVDFESVAPVLAKLLNVLGPVDDGNAGLGESGMVASFASSKGACRAKSRKGLSPRWRRSGVERLGRFNPNRGRSSTADPPLRRCRGRLALATLSADDVAFGFFSSSFDPMTNRALDVIEHAAALCDRLVVGVAPMQQGHAVHGS